jgi:hypothetical protein
MSPAPRQAPALRAYLARVVRRPWPWILRYGLATVPAFLLAPLLLLPLASWFRLPLLLEALETRSLDLLLEVPMHRSQTAAQGPWLALAMLLVPVAWLVVRALAYGLEGGILATYAREEPPTARAFARACFRWFGSFLLLAALALVLIGTLSLLVGVLVVLARMLWRPLGTVVMIVGGLLIVAALVWFELARAAAVARDDRHVLRALRRAVRLVVQRPILLIALVGATLALRVGLALGARLVAGAIPVSWWLATLGVQQAIQVAIVGLNLVRKAGEVGLAIHLAPQASQEGTGG